ncbi:glycosyltransferase family 4 protein [Saccharobesus litoralis]|nr:glycosyltransferase family 4 protein [Saccharobesus litoralis]
MPANPAKILFVHYGEQVYRGSEVCLINLIANLDRNCFEPVLWCNSPEIAAVGKSHNIEVIRSDFSLLLGWQAPRFNVKAFWQQVRQGQQIIKQHNIDLVHCNSAAPTQWMVAACRLTDIPLLSHLHSSYPLRDRITLGLHAANKVVCVNNEIKKQLTDDGMPDERISVIANGLDMDKLQRIFPIDVRQQLKLQYDDILLASTGYLTPVKGMDLCIEAVAELEHVHNIKAHLMLIGDGPEWDNLVTLATKLGVKDRVHLMDSSDLVTSMLWDNADIYLSGSRQEAFGLAIAEAGVANIPVVAPQVGGVPMIVKHEKTGLLYPAQNVKAMATQVARLVENTQLRHHLARALKQHVADNFTIDHYTQHFASTYRQLIRQQQQNKLKHDWSISLTPFKRLASIAWRQFSHRLGNIQIKQDS